MRKLNSRTMITLLMLAALALSCRPAQRRDAVALAMEDDIITLDPYLHDDSITHSVLGNIYDALVSFDREMKLAPALAIRWENPDDLTWRFFLRPGVAFHDGKPLTARDVKYSLERAKRGTLGHYLSMVSSVRILDDQTVEVLTHKPYPVLLNKLTFIDIMPEGSADPIVKPVGTGAYKFVSYVKGRELRLAANPAYWQGRPAIATAVFRMLPDDSIRAQALLNGEVDLIRDVDEPDIRRFRSQPGIETLSRPALGVSLLGVNFAQPGPLRKREVREAIFWALDPAAIIAGSGLEASPINQLVSAYVVGYVPEDEHARPDRERARKLLRQAGYGPGLKLTAEMSKTAAAQAGHSLVAQLREVGIDLTVRAYDWPELSARLDKRQSPFFLVGWSCSSGDASDLFDACLHTRDARSYGSTNWGGYSNRTLDRLIERSSEVLDSRDRIDLLHQAMRMVLDDMPLIPLYVRNRTYGLRAGLSFTPRQDGRIEVWDLAWER
ncbi:MAG TPA: ABC transporter substrate-binding protein [Candidatus Edwardsbacteria bacterium]|nr:ABC transporter substrate-binding protein [Candidatus Edwardsbacteria bacterium]